MNGEHYKDPTASQAVHQVSREQPLQYLSKPVYVRPQYTRKFPRSSQKIEEMSMDDLRPHICNCAKAQMNPLTCVSCEPGCAFGKRAKELMEQESKPTKKDNRGVGKRIKSMQEYQAAIDSGDVMKYAMEHARSSDPKKAKAAAAARVSFWRKNYGGLIKEHAVQSLDPIKEDKPHLSEMSCLSKKVAAERATAEKTVAESTDVVRVLSDKLASLRKEKNDVCERMISLKLKEDSINKQISAILETASALGITIE